MSHPKEILVEALEDALKGHFNGLSSEDISHSVSYCDPKFGEFSTNIAFRLSKSEAVSPQEIADKIVPELSKHKNITSAEFLKPGFINITLNQIGRAHV